MIELAQALSFARLSRAAYSTEPTYGNVDSAARAVVSGQVVTFRGTDDVASFVADLDAQTITLDGLGEIHAGFWAAYSSIRQDLLKLSPSVICGHSLGAALAVIYASDLCLAGKAPTDIYGFEPPRVSADSAIAALLHRNNVRVNLYRDGDDLVTDLPCGGTWQHPAPLIAIGQSAIGIPNIIDHEIDRVIAALS